MFFPFVPVFGPSRNFCAWLLTQNIKTPFFFLLETGRDGRRDCCSGLVAPLEQSLMMIYWSLSISSAKDAKGLALLEQ